MNDRGSRTQTAMAAVFAVLSWLLGLSALTGLLWLGSLAPSFLADMFAFFLPPAWVQAAATLPSKLLGAAATCGWLLWTERESVVRENSQRWLRALRFRDAEQMLGTNMRFTDRPDYDQWYEQEIVRSAFVGLKRNNRAISRPCRRKRSKASVARRVAKKKRDTQAATRD